MLPIQLTKHMDVVRGHPGHGQAFFYFSFPECSAPDGGAEGERGSDRAEAAHSGGLPRRGKGGHGHNEASGWAGPAAGDGEGSEEEAGQQSHRQRVAAAVRDSLVKT